MKLVNFDDFCKMPSGTIFAPYTPYVLRDELAIKVDPGEAIPADYPYYKWCFNGVMPLSPWLDSDCGLRNIGDHSEVLFEIYDGDTNDYCDYEMFLVFEETDIDRMINVLNWAKNGCVGDSGGSDK